jgi:DNA-binding response OmpR family regulator
MISALEDCPRTAAVALVGFEENEIASLEGIFKHPVGPLTSNCIWRLLRKGSVEAAVKALDREAIAIVMCDGDRMPWAWKELLRRLVGLPRPPMQIVTSRLANDRLWAEALNLGAYDVLARPFDATEVLRTAGMAWRRWQDSYAA